MKNTIILGAGGFAREVADIFRDLGSKGEYRLLGFVDRDDSRKGETLNDTAILGAFPLAGVEGPLFGVAGAGEIEPRRRQIAELTAANVTPITLVHPSVIMSPYCRLGAGTIVTIGSILTANITVGAHCLINYGVTVGHDVVMGDNCVLSPGVHVSGWCEIGDDCYIGTGAVLLPKVRLGKGAVVGAGAVVTRDVAAGVTVVGIPARPLAQKGGGSA